jgi:hypothetical protein
MLTIIVFVLLSVSNGQVLSFLLQYRSSTKLLHLLFIIRNLFVTFVVLVGAIFVVAPDGYYIIIWELPYAVCLATVPFERSTIQIGRLGWGHTSTHNPHPTHACLTIG